uniref:Uncharacterized protein n=1 Tax=Anguilla anguilla TaxID=7936 RepID=A0A0E9WST0_ANGAN
MALVLLSELLWTYSCTVLLAWLFFDLTGVTMEKAFRTRTYILFQFRKWKSLFCWRSPN